MLDGKDGDQEAAIAAYREAVATGGADSRVADRLNIWLVKRELYAEAEHVLAQALQEPPKVAGTRDRLRSAYGAASGREAPSTAEPRDPRQMRTF